MNRALGLLAPALAALLATACNDGLAGRKTGSKEGSSGTSGGPLASGYSIDLAQTSASGLSAGGFMAVQLHVAFSSIMKGAAVFAGGPYDCAQGSLTTAEVQCQYPFIAPKIAPFVAATNQYAAEGAIDSPANLAGQRVFLFGGAADYTVNPVTMDALQSYYQSFMSADRVEYESRHAGTGHTMPTRSYGGSCGATSSPWLGACGYDGAGAALGQIYGELNAPAASLGGDFLSMSQSDFIDSPGSHSLADTGYAYVPASCASGETCRIHVSFHGCKQYATGDVGDAYYKHAGYNEWADTNHVIVIYPQTIPSVGAELNPNGCFDWWGYDSPDYAKQSGPQMAMVRGMIRYFAGE